MGYTPDEAKKETEKNLGMKPKRLFAKSLNEFNNMPRAKRGFS